MNEFLLIVDFENGYLPLGIVTMAEAIAAAEVDLASRTTDDLCPETYRLWQRDSSGAYKHYCYLPIIA